MLVPTRVIHHTHLGSRITTRPGGLPLDIWDLVLGSMGPLRSCVSFGLTCKVFACLVEQLKPDEMRPQYRRRARAYRCFMLQRLLQPGPIQPFIMPTAPVFQLLFSSQYGVAKLCEMNGVRVDGWRREIHTTRPGGLPLDVWCIILEKIQDARLLRRCGLTCTTLKSRVDQMQAHLISPYCEAYSDDEDLNVVQFRKAIKENSIVGSLAKHLLRKVHIPAGSLVTFVQEFAGRLTALHTVDVRGSAKALSPLRVTCLRAISRFSNIRKLRLPNLAFWSFSDCMRLISAFPYLLDLTMDNVSWRQAQIRSLAEEPFANSLRLETLAIFSGDVRAYKDLLCTPSLLRSIKTLFLHPVSLPDRSYSAARTILETTRCYPEHVQYSDGSDNIHDPSVQAPLKHAIHRLATIRADDDEEIIDEWYQTCFSVLDSALGSAAASFLDEVEIELRWFPQRGIPLDDIHPNPLPFPALRAKGIISTFNATMQNQYSPIEVVDLITRERSTIPRRSPSPC
ncbi:hypothetical protein OBBRIDRAFT_425433 [Obba rivulosa]|uniref:F-box domain-containing protein n=1 Tax=Obba rivulosa TaxID=1052685 RepID=A0A8E2AKZ9_9APHY|nr:hypothetical protein OBBRIDRAFT_425433 [Obba rivulosa]